MLKEILNNRRVLSVLEWIDDNMLKISIVTIFALVITVLLIMTIGM